MKSSSSFQTKIALIFVLAVGFSVLVVLSGNPWGRGVSRIDGQSRMAMQQAEIRPVALAQAQGVPASVSRPTAAQKAAVADRKPLREIRDEYSQYSAVAVDVERNEVVMADENLFQMLVYDRTTNTPPGAAMSEPKRFIRGPDTWLELQCAIYIDPKNGDIYSLNNDTERHMTVWTRDQKGNQAPAWKLHTPMGSFGLAVDESTQEMLITGQTENVVAAYPKTAREEDSPSWVIWGEKTLLADPHGIALDTKKNLIFVSNFGSKLSPRPLRPGEQYERVAAARGNFIPGSGQFLPVSITVYEKTARNDTAPIRVITGPRTQLNWPTGLFVDSEREELYVSNDGGNSILVFDTDANGNAAPKRVLKGPKTQLSYPSSVFVDLKNDEMWVANFGNHRATVFPRTASGDTAPIRVIRSAPEDVPSPSLANVRIGYDTKREQILAPN
jgi:DNA-binding beta-propeller fold protein YncE